MSDTTELKQLIDSFVEYRNVLAPLQESLRSLAETYNDIRADLELLKKNFSGGVSGQLENIHSTIASQAKSRQVLSEKLDEYASAGDKYAKSVDSMTAKFSQVAEKLETMDRIEKSAEELMARLEAMINEKRAFYNVKELQKSLDAYNKNVEKISEFINKDIADVLQQNAEKIEAIKKENEQLSEVVGAQSSAIAELTERFSQTGEFLRKVAEGGSVNEAYLFDAFDKWAADRKVKIKKQ